MFTANGGRVGLVIIVLCLQNIDSQGYQLSKDAIQNNVKGAPTSIQKSLFKDVLSAQLGNVAGDMKDKVVPSELEEFLPEVTAAIATGAGAMFFGGNPVVAGLIERFLNFGLGQLISMLGKKPKPVPNMPPQITCPASMTVIALAGKQTAIAEWPLPQAFDLEDGDLSSSALQSRGVKRGNTISGENIIVYDVYDGKGRHDWCQFYITVTVIRCQNSLLKYDRHLRTSCDQEVNFGDVCSYNCAEGYTLVGESELTCTVQKRFNKFFPSCQVNKCPDPPKTNGALRWRCTDNYNYGSSCTLLCGAGYRLDRKDIAPWEVATIRCLANKTWTNGPTCKDVSAPSFTSCPQTIHKFADMGTNSTIVFWTAPTASDQHQSDVIVKQTNGSQMGTRLEKGSYVIKYTVTDSAGLTDTCAFAINIMTRSCNVPKLQHPKLNLNCTQSFLHGSYCSVTCSQGIRRIGSKLMSCQVKSDGTMFWSMPGGIPDCDEKDCIHPKSPPNSRIHCSEFFGGTMCNVECNPGHIPARNVDMSSLITCSPANGTWTKPPHPGCVLKRSPKKISSNFLFYWRVRCNDSASPNVTNTFREVLLQDKFLSECKGGNTQLLCQIENIRASCISKRTKQYMTVRWEISSSFDHEDGTSLGSHRIKGVGIKINTWLKRNFKSLPTLGTRSRFTRFKGGNAVVECTHSLSPDQKSQSCAACGLGYEFVDKINRCKLCPRGTYQDDTGDLKCTKCSKGSITHRAGSEDKTDCRARCPPGKYSRTGYTPCGRCPLGTYQSQHGKRDCTACNDDELTKEMGSVMLNECYPAASTVRQLVILKVGSNFVVLRFHRPRVLNGFLKEYSIYYHQMMGNDTKVTLRVDNKTRQVRLEDLLPVTRYMIHVSAVTQHGIGRGSSIHVDTLEAPEIFENVTQTQVNETDSLLENTNNTFTNVNIDPLLCPLGTNSRTGKLSGLKKACEECEYGFYQDKVGQKDCELCPNGYTTWYRGSVSEQDCVDPAWTTPSTTSATTTTTSTTTTETMEPKVPCSHDSISQTGFEPHCTKCPKNKMPNKRQKRCKWLEM